MLRKALFDWWILLVWVEMLRQVTVNGTATITNHHRNFSRCYLLFVLIVIVIVILLLIHFFLHNPLLRVS